jgi:hypothetical protein
VLDALKGRLEAVPLLEEVLPELHASPPARPAAARATSQQIAPGVPAAQPAATVPSASVWDFRHEDKAPSSRVRKAGRSRWVWWAAGGGAAALVLVGGLVALAFRGKTDRSKDKEAHAQVGPQQSPRSPASSREKPTPKDSRPGGPVREADPVSRKEDPPAEKPITAPPPEPERSSFLTEQQYLQEKHLQTYFAANGTVLGRKIVVAGKESPHGIFLHPGERAFSEMTYKLGGNWSTFSCGVAVPRLGEEVEKRGLCLGGALSFEAAGDGQVLWASDSVRDFDRPQWCEVNVEKVDILRLRVYCPGSSWCARAVWIEPRVTTRTSRPRPLRIEGEGRKVLARGGRFWLGPQDMTEFFKDKWSGNTQLWCQSARPGDWVELELPVAADGRYQVLAYLTRARDYGIVQLSLNGKPLGAPIDGYHSPEVVNTGAIELGTVDLNRGGARLRVEVVGTNDRSVGPRYLWGLDCVVLQPVASSDRKPGD